MDTSGSWSTRCRGNAGQTLAHVVSCLWHIGASIAVLPNADEVPHFTTQAAKGYMEQLHGNRVAPSIAQLHMEHFRSICGGFVMRCHTLLIEPLVGSNHKLLQRLSEQTSGLTMKERIRQGQALSHHAELVIQLHNGITHHVEQRCNCRSLAVRRSLLNISPRVRNQAHLKGERDDDQRNNSPELVHEELGPHGMIDLPDAACKAERECNIRPD
mmetsp:Transcript_77135/g.249859  ORF Transcript_77135/g.249859 Transcript_77135/m.249859 type:complete len:214 (+) Transcript_77135:1068-1709(+)